MSSQKMRPLVERIESHISLDPVSLHVPGHKNGQLYPEKWQPFLKYDLTEITGLDDLYHSEAAIEEARCLLTDCYGAEESYFLVNGTTGGNLAMILSAVRRGEKVLLPRDVHKSILHGLELAGAVPVFLTAAIDPEIGVASGVSSELLEQAFALHPDIVACIFTYPSYYGTVFDLAACIRIAHRYEAVVLVDEAHGAHFAAAHADFPADALRLGADAVVQSAHKTLPALTMGSFLHIASDHPRLQAIPRYLQMVQSSSPSYLIMASLDIARHYLANYQAADWEAFQKMRTEWQEALTANGFEVLTPNDPLKLVIRRSGYTGFELLAEFEQSGYFPELADERQILLILPLLKKGGIFPAPAKWRTLKPKEGSAQFVHRVAVPEIAELAMSYESMRGRETTFLSLEEVVGYVAAENVMTYPPGIPEVIRGEQITVAHLSVLQRIKRHRYQGGEKLHENKLKVFKKI
ncbi:aminotransferase class I/II-fold pyridoxal phosphate-dependent enzyme [Listeria ilorinensis]|uniref:aminotransferase class I/II-fold pyridoxal phosphate-dependent enzyme n=1 Tax=Listeria ilorinensis TaxID=2867439 RepID=UPI001EF617F0|nr:aminotransferase class I/II-fold pyridoxal phosphate-dependent enzyme [Listeria ilorinensis]